MTQATYAVFGGTGFLGRRIVQALSERGQDVRVATRHPERVQASISGGRSRIEAVRADVHDEASITAALTGVQGAVNAVSLYVERGRETFHSVHVEAASRVARCAREAGVERFVHISGIGADAASRSPYIRSRGEGDEEVARAFPGATILRSSVMVGPDDAFLTAMIGLVRRLPAIPLFGSGATLLQPADVEDVGQAAAHVLLRPEPSARLYELSGATRIRYRDLLALIGRRLGKRRLLLPVPFAVWMGVGWAAEFLPSAPITRNQVELMRKDNVASPDLPGFAALAISPQPVEEVLARHPDAGTGRSGQI